MRRGRQTVAGLNASGRARLEMRETFILPGKGEVHRSTRSSTLDGLAAHEHNPVLNRPFAQFRYPIGQANREALGYRKQERKAYTCQCRRRHRANMAKPIEASNACEAEQQGQRNADSRTQLRI